MSDLGKNADLFATEPTGEPTLTRRHAITDAALSNFQKAYPNEPISKEDIFFYIYGLLHSEDYKTRYADNLSKELPRIPCVKKASDFWHFSQAGRDLGALHVNYEAVPMHPVDYIEGALAVEMMDDNDF